MKRKVYLITAFFLSIIALNSCNKKESPVVVVKDTAVSQDVLNKIKAMGFSTDGVRQYKDGYIAEGDIFLSKESLGNISNSPNLVIAKVEQYRTYNIISGLPRVITISVNSATLSQNFLNATDIAISRYNNLHLNLSFQRVNSSGNIQVSGADLGVDPKTGGTILGLSPNFPSSAGNPGGTILLNNVYYTSNTDSYLLASVIQHEMGHAIGLRHTDYLNRSFSCGPNDTRNEGQTADGALQIPGTPSGPDDGSLMLACNPGIDRTFNGNDILALHYLYGGSFIYAKASTVFGSYTVSGGVTTRNGTFTIKLYSDDACTQPLTFATPFTVLVNINKFINPPPTSSTSTTTYTIPAGQSSYSANIIASTVTENIDTGSIVSTTYTYSLINNGIYIVK